MIPAPKKYPVFIQMAPGAFSTATLFTLPHSTSRSGQIIEPQLNRGSIRSPAQRSFVPIYFKKSRRYHLSNVLYVIARAVFVCPKQSPGSTQPAISRIPPPHTKHHHLFKTLTWTSSNRNGFVPRIFLKCPQIEPSHLGLNSPVKNVLKTYSYRGSNKLLSHF